MLQNIIEALRQWAQKETSIESVILVGSWARGTNRPDSDMDLCILTARREGLLAENHFPSLFGKVCRQQTEYYGACTSVRVWYEGGGCSAMATACSTTGRGILTTRSCRSRTNCRKGDRACPYSGVLCFSKNCCTHSSSCGWMSG